MKREGRQHGVVRTHPILPTPLARQRRYVKTVDSASVAGLFTKVSRKPTNQSKFTGKCGTPRCLGCHTHPVCRSKDKAKGTMKLRSIGSDCPSGSSAIDALAYLARDGGYDQEDAIDDYDYDFEFGIGVESIVTEEVIEVENEDEEWYFVGHFQ
ncbi:hypothetical protein SSX86_018869 [Deinandra increscens subsp. villosa]|uniref:Uncharacterized protein n=1 Tax=Deinandra increscens subsp. villosa TaxID=3103831 RepID=A0AAP0CT52_9ASTR